MSAESTPIVMQMRVDANPRLEGDEEKNNLSWTEGLREVFREQKNCSAVAESLRILVYVQNIERRRAATGAHGLFPSRR